MNDLLITSQRHLIVWDNKNKKQYNIIDGNCYGLTWDKESIYYSYNPPHDNVSIVGKLNKLLVKQQYSQVYRDVHQILFNDDRLHIVNTGGNNIAVHHNDEYEIYNWTKHEVDQHHFNSIWMDNDKIYIAESGLRNKEKVAIQVLDKNYKKLFKIKLPGAIHIHNVYIENDMLYSCGKFGLVQKNLHSNEIKIFDLRYDISNSFFRGFARSKKYFFIGESQTAERKERDSGDASIHILNNDLVIIDTIELKNVGQVKDIHIIDDFDFAHNSIKCPVDMTEIIKNAKE